MERIAPHEVSRVKYGRLRYFALVFAAVSSQQAKYLLKLIVHELLGSYRFFLIVKLLLFLRLLFGRSLGTALLESTRKFNIDLGIGRCSQLLQQVLDLLVRRCHLLPQEGRPIPRAASVLWLRHRRQGLPVSAEDGSRRSITPIDFTDAEA